MLTAAVDTIVGVTGGELIAGPRDKIVNEVCVDSRCVSAGCLFVAMPGDRADGHDFARAAIDDGARALIVTRAADEIGELVEQAVSHDVAVVRVQDAVEALQALAAYHRSRLHCQVLGITGSTGKTTTKDFVTAALSAGKEVVSTQGNRNNEIGVPLTVLQAGSSTEVLVVEMGMRGLGQIARLCEIARPTMGLLTNVGTSHIELLGSQDAVAEAKGELIRCLGAQGVAFLNGDDQYSARIAESTAATVVCYGLSEGCDVRAEDIELDEESRASFMLVAEGVRAAVKLGIPGRHNVYNALGACAVALRLGIPADAIASSLQTAGISAMRMQVFNSADGVTVVNDAYNANPSSMRAAIETLAAMHADRKRIAVLGDMAELGGLTELAHFQMGELVARHRIDTLVTAGARARRIAEGAKADGMAASDVHSCETSGEAGDVVAELVSAGDVVLVKASRVMGLETVVDRLMGAR